MTHYTADELRHLFQSPFEPASWKDFLLRYFRPRQLRIEPEPILPSSETEEGYYLGALETPDRYRIGLFHYIIRQGSVANKRVGLRRLVRTFINPHWGDFDAALVVFDSGDHWRLSFICDLREEATSPTRYTYVLGDADNHYNTPVTRFLTLQQQELSFVNLKEAFSVEALTKQFYNDLFGWYQWAVSPEAGITFPNNTATEADDRENLDMKIIRMITRIMFVWFIKQKELVPESLFDVPYLQRILRDFDPQDPRSGSYYNAILQNLFFATLNRAIMDDEGNPRSFAHRVGGKDLKTLYRYAELFTIPEAEVIELFSAVPFLNGGLFECLDKTRTIDGVEQAYNYDGFSRNDKTFADGRYRNRACVPNVLFFEPERGLFSILSRYNFTIEENSPNEQQVALDPELLGKVFENLLGAYNPETQETARNQSGSFYTPREVVNFMVDASLKAYLGGGEVVERLFREDFEVDAPHAEDYRRLASRLRHIRILDPACGSGAFPMGLLNRMVELLQRIDPTEDTYRLKLNLIEECIYGVDIQSIATQISKLRFFISLICDCQKDPSQPNYGIPTLPNLETKFISANALIGKKRKAAQLDLFDTGEIDRLKEELLEIRRQHFGASSSHAKRRLRSRDESLRHALARELSEKSLYSREDALQLSQWNPYDQQGVSPFFDSEWMFGVKDGFDIVIGNPPYISTKGIKSSDKKNYEQEFGFSDDTYNLFTFKGLQLTRPGGSLIYIIPKTFWTTQTKRTMRDLILGRTIDCIFDTANPFESVLVDTCIIQITNSPAAKSHQIKFLDGSTSIKYPHVYPPIDQSIYRNTQNSVIFRPTELNLKIYNRYGNKIKELYEQWWDKIKTSRDIEKNKQELEAYRDSLKPGDIALLGCLTEGGQGLATANNGKYIAVRRSTKWAQKIIESRPKKLKEAVQKYQIPLTALGDLSVEAFMQRSSEAEIVAKFDELKEHYGRDIFGQGYIYRLVDDSEIADVDTLTQDEKENGIDSSKNYYVPYDKGDKDGNRWYLETPFAIAWSKENVHFLKTDPKARYQGYAFYFREGFCWNNVLNPNARLLKVRLKASSVNDVGSMSLYPTTYLDSLFYIAVLNSNLIFDFYREFVNCTVNIQINDLKQLPICIPNQEQLSEVNSIVSNLIQTKKANSTPSSRSTMIETMEKLLDDLIYRLYMI